jgi:ubiquinone/menaquinone biosynthesis C-methylase UbiE
MKKHILEHDLRHRLCFHQQPGSQRMPKPSTEAVQRQFGAVAAAYATSPIHSSGPDLAELVRIAALTGRERILDLGCGAGHTAHNVAPHAAEVVGVDVTPEMLEVAAGLARDRGLTNVRFQRADVLALPFADASFDLVTSRYSAHHYADPAKALTEAARVLRPGGRMLLVDTVAPEDSALDIFCNAFELLRDASHVRNCRLSEWLRLFDEAGFAARERYRMSIDIDAEAWVVRSQTPPHRVAALRDLFREATPAAGEFFRVSDDPWSFILPSVLIEATLR